MNCYGYDLLDRPGMQLFAFHGRKNKPLETVEPGDFNGETLKPTGSFWVIHDPDVKLEVGDTVHFWIFIQHNRLGYRRDGQTWNVTGKQ